MADNEQQEKKQFSVPSRDELIQSIKDLDQDIEHVTLNLIKCDFNAKEKDIEKAFPEFHFIKIKNYNPGSFEVVFQMRIDAINFIRNHYDKKILSRRFFIKMGRQQKQTIEDWTGVGSVPRQFRGPNKPHQKDNRPQKDRKPEGQKTQQQTETEEKPTTKETQVKPEVKTETKEATKPTEQVKKEGKQIPKVDNYHKKPEYKKPVHHENVKKEGEHAPKKEATHQPAKKQETHHASKKEETHHAPKKEGEKKEVHHKKQEKVEHKKQQPKKEQVPKKAPEVAHEKKEDDGWIVVGGNKNQKKR